MTEINKEFWNCCSHTKSLLADKKSEYDQEIPQPHTADQHTAPRGRTTRFIVTINLFDSNRRIALERKAAQATVMHFTDAKFSP